MALFDSSPLIQNSKFNNFLWVCWFLGKNLPNFVYSVWKLHNPYCHNMKLFLYYQNDSFFHQVRQNMTTNCSLHCSGVKGNSSSLWWCDHSPVHKGAFCPFSFRWIHYYGSNKSTGLENGKSHLRGFMPNSHKKSLTVSNQNVEHKTGLRSHHHKLLELPLTPRTM